MRKRQYTCLKQGAGYPELAEGVPLPVVHNIVATSQIEGSVATLDLTKICALLPFSFYDKNKFAAITIRLSNPECTTLLFSSGKLVVTGGRTWYESVYASLHVAHLLAECMPGETFRLIKCEVQNMVAHVELPVGAGMLDIQTMYARLALNCTYQRKMFPGLIFRPEASPVVLLCFYSGKIVITGGKTMSDIFDGWTRLWPTVRAFISADPPPNKRTRGGSAKQPQAEGFIAQTGAVPQLLALGSPQGSPAEPLQADEHAETQPVA